MLQFGVTESYQYSLSNITQYEIEYKDGSFYFPFGSVAGVMEYNGHTCEIIRSKLTHMPNELCYGNGIWLAAQVEKTANSSTDNCSIYRTDDETAKTGWVYTSPIQTNGRITGLAFGNGIFVMTTGSYGRVLYSTNGSTWELKTGIISSSFFVDVTFVNDRFYAIPYNNKDYIYHSIDGNAWDRTSISGITGNPVRIGNLCGNVVILDTNRNAYLFNGAISQLNIGISAMSLGGTNSSGCITSGGELIAYTKDASLQDWIYYKCPESTAINSVCCNENSIITVDTNSVYVIKIMDLPQTPSDAFINISKKLQYDDVGVINELASMIRSGVESTLV